MTVPPCALCVTCTFRPSISPSCRSSAARSASTVFGAFRRAGAADVVALAYALRLLGAIFGLTHREALGNDFLGERLGIGRGRDRSGMTHADIALQ